MGLGLALGAAAGGLLGGLGSKGGSQTVKTELPSWYRNYISGNDGVLPEAKRLFDQGPNQYYTGNTVADFSADQNAAFDSIRNSATNNPYSTAQNNLVTGTLNGDYLGGGEYMKAYGNDVLDNVNTMFSRAGRTGSGYHAKTAAEGLGKVTAGLYDAERGRQQQTLGMLPSFNQSRYQDAQALLGIGGAQQQQAQNQINADMQRYNYNQNADWDNLNKYANLVYGAPHGQTQTTPLQRNTAAGVLGGALGGLQLASGISGLFSGGGAPAGGMSPVSTGYSSFFGPLG